MGVDLLLDAVLEGEFDPRCTRIEVALRALWVLYLRDKWDLLAECGLDREQFETLFRSYRITLETDDRSPRIRTDQQTLAFLRFTRAWGQDEAISLLSAAVWMVGQYMTRRNKVRAAWYGRTYKEYPDA
jgi:hypothetical protein